MEGVMTGKNKLAKAWSLSLLVTLAMLLIGWQQNTSTALVVATPFSLIAYALYFSVGVTTNAANFRQWCHGNLMRYLALPLVLVALLFLYVVLSGGKPLTGNSWQIPLLFCAPVLFYRITGSDAAITWKDAVGSLLCILPYVLHDYPFDSRLPSGGGGIETLYLTFAVIIAAYAQVVVRNTQGVGFVPFYSTEALKTALKGWVLFFALVAAIGIPGGLMKWVGYEPFTSTLVVSGLAHLLRTLFGTALEEELVFRGIFLNLLQQRIQQTGNWKHYLYGSLALLPLTAVLSYKIGDQTQWFPLLCAVVLWGMAGWFIRRNPAQTSTYTALLIVSTLFGLAHFHAQSTLFMGLAMVAGWVYGRVYQKTGNVYYSALCHTLVNVTPALFGLELHR